MACCKHREAKSKEASQNVSARDTQVQMFVQTDDKVVDGRYNVADIYDPFDVPSFEYYPDAIPAIHAAGNLRQHEGPSTRNMCM